MKRKDWGWLHFIGNQYYDVESFTREATTLGVSRRISLAILRQMNWGDYVICCIKIPGEPEADVFLEFHIDRIVGLSGEALKRFRKEFPNMKKVDEGGDHITRECGEYDQGSTYSVDFSIQELSQFLIHLKEHDVELGSLMVGCSPERVRVFRQPYPTLLEIKFYRGFRPFDRRKFWKIIRQFGKGKNVRVRIKDEFTASVQHYGTTKGNVVEVSNYKRA